MSRHHLALALVAVLAVTAGCSFFGPNPDSYTSTYYYSVGVDADESLQDVTIRLPLPQLEGDTAMNASTVAPNGTVEGAFTASVVETERGPMLELVAEEFRVETRYYRFVEEDGMGRRERISESEYDPSDPDHQKVEGRTVGVSVMREVEYPIETRAPVGRSPTLYAEGAVTRELADCRFPYDDEIGCFAYDAPVYLSYDTSPNATVRGNAAFTGSNEWFTGGWTGNEYMDRTSFTATGPQDGWVTARGYTETGHGRYPSPEP